MSLLAVWIIYTTVGMIGFGAVFVWAIRTRQFTELDRQRYIALNAEALPDSGDRPGRVSRLDAYAWPALFVIAFAAIGAALWLGAKGG